MATPLPLFRFPGGDARTTVIGATGSGKTTNGVWLLAHQRFDKRPWIVVDFKREQIFDQIGLPPIQQITLRGRVPRKPGLYLVSPRPDQDDALEDWLWRVWERENVGLFVDEASLMPDKDAFRAVLQQGRSKRIPLIACTQRPVDVKRGLFSEASYFCVYRMADKRDYRTVEGFIPGDLSRPMPPHHWLWYDVAKNRLLHMGPVPKPAIVADMARAKIPYVTTWHPFGWTGEPSGRAALRRAG
jgi:DNA helicase HerA-like ATPase